MASEADFLNGALGLIGAEPIENIDEGTTNANWCLTYWPQLRKSMIRSHHWNFAEDRGELVPNVVVPPFEFSLSFQLPPDLLKITEFNGFSVIVPPNSTPYYWEYIQGRYKIAGRNLFTNDSQAFIVYLKDIENPDLWDAIFYQAAESWLASKLARPIRKDSRLAESLMGVAVNVLLPLGMAVDGQEGSTRKYVNDDLIAGRD